MLGGAFGPPTNTPASTKWKEAAQGRTDEHLSQMRSTFTSPQMKPPDLTTDIVRSGRKLGDAVSDAAETGMLEQHRLHPSYATLDEEEEAAFDILTRAMPQVALTQGAIDQVSRQFADAVFSVAWHRPRTCFVPAGA